MSKLKVKEVLLGDNADPSKNFVISTPAVADGTLSIKRQDGTNVLSIDATGKAVIPGVVGTVAQVGGIPTGQVVERGSNANGEYVRFADGTQICSVLKGVSAGTTIPLALTFPAVFSNSGYSLSSSSYQSAGTNPTTVGIQAVYGTGSTAGVELRVTSPSTVTVTTTIVGRWY